MHKVFLAIVAAAITFSAPPWARAANFDQNFDGTWIGVIRRIDMALYNPVEPTPETERLPPIELAISVDSTAVLVRFNSGKGWTDVKPGAFQIDSHKTNAVIYATTSWISDDESMGWVETWNLTLSHKDDDTLYAYWVRAVNNYAMPAMSDPNARFAMIGHGELALSPPVTGPGRITVSGQTGVAKECSPMLLSCEGVEFSGRHVHP